MWEDSKRIEKPKTSVLFDDNGEVKCNGNNALNVYMSIQNCHGWKLFEKFKMNLYEYDPKLLSNITSSTQSRKDKTVDIKQKIKATNDEKQSESSEIVFIAQLKYLKESALKFIRALEKMRKYKRQNLKIEDDEIQWILTVPAIWSEKAKQQMKQWAIKADIINKDTPSQMKVVYEPVRFVVIGFVFHRFENVFLNRIVLHYQYNMLF